MDLKWLLVRRIAVVALACLFAGSMLAVVQTAQHARQQNAGLVELVGKRLAHQLGRVDGATELPKGFPDWDPVTGLGLQPGQCVEFRGPDGTPQRSRCAGMESSAAHAPGWFVALYHYAINPFLEAHGGVPGRSGDGNGALGEVIASHTPAATAEKAWATIAPLIGLSAVFVASLCVVTYAVIDRALRPTNDVLAGLNQLAHGDLSVRLPRFQLAELDRISDVFNVMSADLSKATVERTELARRLVDAQERERRHIARELHDEIAQKLSALNAVAACIRTSAQREAPGLVAETRELEAMASDVMMSLRRTLTHLRPQVIDDLGLVQSLQALINEHNIGARGRTTYSMSVTGDIERLNADTSAHVYRIVQEGLTNASKHAHAQHVTVMLDQMDGEGHERIRLAVSDDGAGQAAIEPSRPQGVGLIGMRERVAALSGKLVAGPLPSGGFHLHVEFPTLAQGA